jgi:tartrate dehydrogenase/decarboxylase/D-malate dehydrogenase
MMLDHLGHPEAHDAILRAMRRVLGETDVRTPDLGGSSSTREVADAVLEALRVDAGAAA